MALTCPDCHRKLTRPRTSGATEAVKTLLEATSRTCVWCFCRNLMAGGFEPDAARRLYQGEELRLLRDEAAALKAERMKPKARRRVEKKAPAQGSLAA